jgi:uncharacterized membrane protein
MTLGKFAAMNVPQVGPPREFIWIFIGLIGAIAALSYLVAERARPRSETPESGWKGIFYVNPNDPSLFVEKRYGIGYTLNFGNRWSWAVMGLILALVAAPLVYTAHSIHNAIHSTRVHSK